MTTIKVNWRIILFNLSEKVTAPTSCVWAPAHCA